MDAWRRTTAILVLVLGSRAGAQSTRFAIIGDYGIDDSNESAVAARVKTYNPSTIFTVGDNNYFLGGSLADWDRTQGKYYGEYIKYPAGSASAYAGNGVAVNHFYPSLGNHDWDAGVNSYTSYFELPGNERYYSVVQGPVEFFILDSDSRESDGITTGSTQYNWAANAIQNSAARWQVVLFHHPAWTYQTNHGPATAMRWPFASWGVDAVVSGHNHDLQRMSVDGLPYYVSGAAGYPTLYPITGAPSGATGLWYNDSIHGFLLLDATQNALNFQFIDRNGIVLDSSVVPEPAGLFLTLALIWGRWTRRRGARN